MFKVDGFNGGFVEKILVSIKEEFVRKLRRVVSVLNV